MAWEFTCPEDDCDYVTAGNDQRQVIEDAQQHVGDAHGDVPERTAVEERVVGP